MAVNKKTKKAEIAIQIFLFFGIFLLGGASSESVSEISEFSESLI